jgi:hypothetical protein
VSNMNSGFGDLSCLSYMKKILLLFFVGVSLNGFCQKDPEGFVLVRSEPPFEVHERWVEFPGKKPPVISRELKSEFTIQASMYEILRLLKDETQVKDWQSHVSEYRIYRKQDTSCWDVYSRHDVPWPVSDQDSFMEYRLTEVKPGQELLISFKSRVDHTTAPEYDDINRIELIGSWKLAQESPALVRVTYRIQSAPATSLPRMVVDPVIRNNLLSSIKSLKELAEK